MPLIKLLLHFLSNHNYGVHRDEFLYRAMGDHLAWGYLEVPPLIALLARISSWLGDSLFALRLFPALAGALLVLLSGLLTRELGGRRFAQVLAMLAVIIAPVFLRAHTLFQPVAFDQLAWLAGVYLLVLLLREPERRKWWLYLGAVLGVGLLNKYAMLFFGFGLTVGLLIGAERKWLRTSGPWLAALLALAIFLPNLLWQIKHGWPVFEHIAKLNLQQLDRQPRSTILLELLLIHHPFNALIWLSGIGFFFFSKAGRPYRLLGWIYLVILLVMLLLRGKAYYLSPAYPMLFAGGAVLLERFIQGRGWYWLKPALITIMLLQGILIAPYGLPILPQKSLESYVQFMAQYAGLDAPLRTNRGELGKLPQDYADMFGWPEQVETIAGVYNSLSEAEREKCVLLAGNYGEAGAIDYYGPRLGLPRAVSIHSSYYLWGPGEKPGEIAIAIGLPLEALTEYYRSVRRQALITNGYAVAEENNVPVYLCRGQKKTLQEAWGELRKWR